MAPSYVEGGGTVCECGYQGPFAHLSVISGVSACILGPRLTMGNVDLALHLYHAQRGVGLKGSQPKCGAYEKLNQEAIGGSSWSA